MDGAGRHTRARVCSLVACNSAGQLPGRGGHKQAARGGVPGEGHISPSHLRMLPADQLLVVLRGPLDDDLQLAQRLCRLGDAQAQVILLRGAEGGLRRQARRALLLLLDALNQLLQLAQPGGQEAGGRLHACFGCSAGGRAGPRSSAAGDSDHGAAAGHPRLQPRAAAASGSAELLPHLISRRFTFSFSSSSTSQSSGCIRAAAAAQQQQQRPWSLGCAST